MTIKNSSNMVTVINGCEAYEPLETAVLDLIRQKLNDLKVEFEWIDLKEKKFSFCRGCDACQVKTPGLCIIRDGLNDILKMYLQSRQVIIISPVLFGCCNSLTKNFIDRTEPLFLPYQVLHNKKTVMKKRYDKYPGVLCIGIDEQDGEGEKVAFSEFIDNCSLLLAGENLGTKLISDQTDLERLNVYFQQEWKGAAL